MAYGDITKAVIDTLSLAGEASLGSSSIHVTGDIIATAYYTQAGPTSVKLVTYDCDDTGQLGSVIDSITVDTNSSHSPYIFHISGTTYAIAYVGPDSDGFLKTYTITADGIIIGPLDTAEFDAVKASDPMVVSVSGTVYAILYAGDSQGKLQTRTIAADGTIGSLIDNLDFGVSISHPNILHISGNFYLLVFGWKPTLYYKPTAKTIEIDSSGNIAAAFTDTLELDSSNVTIESASLVELAANYYALFYHRSSGYIKTFDCDDSGNLGSVIDTFGFWPVARNLTALSIGEQTYMAVYYDGNNDGRIITVTISDVGIITDPIIDSWEFNNVNAQGISIVHRSGDIYVICYTLATIAAITLGVETPTTEAIILEMAFAQSILTASPTWTDVTDYLMSLQIKRGRMHDLDKVDAGTAVFQLLNTDAAWWRDNTGSSYYPDVKPITLIRLSYRYDGTTYRRFYGVIESFKHGFLSDRGGKVPIVTVSCVDLFKSLNRWKLLALTGTVGSFQEVVALSSDAASGQKDVAIKSLDDSSTEGADITLLHVGQSVTIGDDNNSETNTIASIDTDTYTLTMTNNLANTYQTADNAYVKKFPAALSGTRITDVCYELGWPIALTDIDTGQLTMAELVPDTGGVSALEHLLAVAESEGGLLFIATDGTLTFQDRDARLSSPYTTAQATFADDGVGQKFIMADPEDDDTFIYNEARISGSAIDEQSYADATAQALQGARVLSRKSSLLSSNQDAFDQAFVIVERFKDSVLRVPSLLVMPDADPDNLWAKVLGYDLSTRINLEINQSPNSAELDRDYHIEGIEDVWRVDGLWQTKWQLWDVNLFRIFQTEHDGYIEHSDITTYLLVHNAATGSDAYNDGSYLLVGQLATGTGWLIDRGYLEFDTSVIGAGASIAEAKLLLMVTTESEGTYYTIDNEFDLTLTPATNVANPLNTTDYGDLLDDVTDYGHVTISTPAANRQLIVITLNSTGIAAISKTGTTRFGLRSSRDINSNSPAANEKEYIGIMGKTGDFVPRLVVKLNEVF